LGWKMNRWEISDRGTGLLVLLLLVLGLYGGKPVFESPPPEGVSCDRPFFVEIAGEVRVPGVYASCGPVGVGDLIRKAGGPSSPGNGPQAGREASLCSGARVEVRKPGERWLFSHGEMSAFYKMTLGIPLSLNTESEEGLTALPGIGPGLARAIIKERARRGGFSSTEELRAVKGIGEKLYGSIRSYLVL